jgi:predicted CXXCH cytochrome family protein
MSRTSRIYRPNLSCRQSIRLAVCALLLPRFFAAAQPASSAFAAPGACALCHQRIWETYRKTGMGRSFYRPPAPGAPESPAGAYYHKPSDSHFTMSWRGGRYMQRRHQTGPGGREINVMEKQVDFILGSGNHARTFLHRTARNTLVELPLGWYAENGGYLAMNPGYDRPDHEGFRRKIAYDCMFCHNGYPKIPAGHERSFAEPVYLDPLPMGIDCQRCHGPGQRHADLAGTAGAKAAEIRAAIINPRRLASPRREEICIQCHLESTSFPLPNSIQKFGRGPFAYRPGEPLADYWLFFDHAPNQGRDDKFEIVNAVYRMRRSKCFLASGGKLECTTCHNPHDAPRGAEATRHYDARCRQCHSASFDRAVASGRHTRDAGCAACHMPKRRTEDVVHSVATDHFIARRPPAGDLLAERAERHETGDSAYKGEVVLYYPETLPAGPDRDLYPALAQVVDKSNLTAGIERLSAAIERHRVTQPEFYLALAEAWRNNGQPAKALPLYREAARRAPRSAAVLLKLGSALRDSGKSGEAAVTLNLAAAAAPGDPAIWHELGQAYRELNNMAEAAAALEKAIKLDPDLSEPHSNLGIVKLVAGDTARAEAEFREAIRIQPDYPDAHNNLGNLLAGAGAFPEARHHFETSLRLRPGDGRARYNFAMALGRAREFDEAQRQLERSLEALPELAEARLVLAQLLAAKGETPAAILHLKKTAAAADPEVRKAAVDLLRQLESGR